MKNYKNLRRSAPQNLEFFASQKYKKKKADAKRQLKNEKDDTQIFQSLGSVKYFKRIF